MPFLLVGIQDPPNDALDTASRKKARVDEGTKLAREIGAEKYVECELTSQRGVKNVFDEVGCFFAVLLYTCFLEEWLQRLLVSKIIY